MPLIPALLTLLALTTTSVKTSLDLEATIAEGTRLHDAGRYDEAIATYARVLALEPRNELALHETVVSLIAKGSAEEAVALCRRVLAETKPSQPGFDVHLGIALDRLGRLEEGEKAFRAGLERWPDAQALRFNLGVNLLGQGKAAAAEAELDRSLALDERHAGTWHHLGLAARAQRLPLASWIAFARSCTLPADPKLRRAMAQLLWDMLFENVKTKPATTTGEPPTTAISLDANGSPEQTGQALVLATVAASRTAPEKQSLSDADFFVDAFDTLTATAGGLLPGEGKRTWPLAAVAYFDDARKAGQLAAMAWTIRASLDDPQATKWVASHPDAVAAYRSWTDGWSFAKRGSSGH